MYYKYHTINIYYEKIGTSKNTILILPGWGNTRQTFNTIINELKKENTIYIIDYPGFGNSPTPKKDLTIYNYSEIIYSFIEEKNLSNIIIIAHSFGGRISSILLGKYHLKINKLILIDVAGIKRLNIVLKIKTLYYKILKLLTNLLPLEKKYRFRRKLFLKYSSQDYLSLPNNMYKTFKNIINENLYKYYKKIHNTTLIIWGKNDRDTPIKNAKKLKKIIKKSILITFNNAGHFSYIDKEKETLHLIKNFIKKED